MRADPVDAPVGEPTIVTATLANAGDGPVGVNRRMLVNHRGLPGEAWIDVQGPPGYESNRDFSVNVGSAPAEFFVELAPGATRRAVVADRPVREPPPARALRDHGHVPQRSTDRA